jgi:hypothetical protein
MHRYVVARCAPAGSAFADDGYQVVGAGVTDWQDSPIRFVATLTEGQEFVIPVSAKWPSGTRPWKSRVPTASSSS